MTNTKPKSDRAANAAKSDGVAMAPAPDDFAKWINAAWQKSIEGIIEVGQLLNRAKTELPHGQFGLLFSERKVPFSQRMSQRLMEIAQHPVIANATHGSLLPPHWRTLHALTQLPVPKLEQLLNNGTINPETERKDVERLVQQMRPASFIQALEKIVALMEYWPDAEAFAALVTKETLVGSKPEEDLAPLLPWLTRLNAFWERGKTSEEAKPITPVAES